MFLLLLLDFHSFSVEQIGNSNLFNVVKSVISQFLAMVSTALSRVARKWCTISPKRTPQSSTGGVVGKSRKKSDVQQSAESFFFIDHSDDDWLHHWSMVASSSLTSSYARDRRTSCLEKVMVILVVHVTLVIMSAATY